MTFEDVLTKLCLMAVIPHNAKCPQGMDARLKCECQAGMQLLKVQGCKENLLTMWQAKVGRFVEPPVVAPLTPARFLPEPDAPIPPAKPMALPEFENGSPPRPTKMHWKTAEKIAKQQASLSTTDAAAAVPSPA